MKTPLTTAVAAGLGPTARPAGAKPSEQCPNDDHEEES